MKCIINHLYIAVLSIRIALANCFILQPTVLAAGKQAPRAGNIGHITRIANKLVHLAHSRSLILTCLQVSCEYHIYSIRKASSFL